MQALGSTRTSHTAGRSCQSMQDWYSKCFWRMPAVTLNRVFYGQKYWVLSEHIVKSISLLEPTMDDLV